MNTFPIILIYCPFISPECILEPVVFCSFTSFQKNTSFRDPSGVVVGAGIVNVGVGVFVMVGVITGTVSFFIHPEINIPITTINKINFVLEFDISDILISFHLYYVFWFYIYMYNLSSLKVL